MMENCFCNKYQYGDEVKLPDPTWQYVKEGFMGTVYKCGKCGCLWFKTISSGIIGMPIYVQSKPDTDFGKPSPSAPLVDLSKWNNEQGNKWVQFLSRLPKDNKAVICDNRVPKDIIRILYFVLGNDQHKVNEWLNSHVILQGNIFIPIRLLEKDESGNELRFLILEKLINQAED